MTWRQILGGGRRGPDLEGSRIGREGSANLSSSHYLFRVCCRYCRNCRLFWNLLIAPESGRWVFSVAAWQRFHAVAENVLEFLIRSKDRRASFYRLFALSSTYFVAVSSFVSWLVGGVGVMLQRWVHGDWQTKEMVTDVERVWSWVVKLSRLREGGWAFSIGQITQQAHLKPYWVGFWFFPRFALGWYAFALRVVRVCLTVHNCVSLGICVGRMQWRA